MSKGSVARAILVGRMGGDIEVKTIGAKQTRVGNFSLAVSEGWGDSVTTSWFRVQVFGDRAIDALSAYTEKGSRVYVEGQLRIRKYTNRDGGESFATEVVVGFDGLAEIIDGKKNGSGLLPVAGSVRIRHLHADSGAASMTTFQTIFRFREHRLTVPLQNHSIER